MSSPGVIQRKIGPTAVTVPDTGVPVFEGMHQLADATGKLGEMIGQAENAGRLSNAVLQATHQLNDVSLKFAQDDDPATAPTRFADQAAKIKDDLAATLPDPESLHAFTNHFDALSEARLVDVKTDALKRATADANASVMDGLDQYAIDAAAARNPVERLAVVTQAGDSLKKAVQAGVMSAKEAQRLGSKWRQQLTVYDAKRDILADPSGALKQLQGKGYPELDPNTRITLMDRADAEIRQREREARAAFTQHKAEVSATLSDVSQQLAAGLPVDPTFVHSLHTTVTASGDPLLANRYDTVMAAVTVHDKLRGAPPSEVARAIDNLEIEGGKHPSAPLAAALLSARRFAMHQNEGLSRDPLTWAASQGTVQLAPLTLNGSDKPEDWKARIAAGDTAAATYGRAPVYLTAAESSLVKNAIANAPTADAKLTIAQNLIAGLGDHAAGEFHRLAPKDPVFAQAGALALSGKHDGARDALVGQELMRVKGSGLTLPLAVNGTIAGDVRSAFRFAPSMVGLVLSTANAIYAKRASDKGLTGADAQNDGSEILDRALQEAAGAGYDAQDNRYGGIVDFHGRKVAAPATIKADDFAPILKGLTPSQLLQGSAYGGPPLRGDGSKFEDGLGNAYLIAVGDGRYVVSTTDPQGEPHLLKDPKAPASSDHAYVLDLHRVLPWMNTAAKKTQK